MWVGDGKDVDVLGEFYRMSIPPSWVAARSAYDLVLGPHQESRGPLGKQLSLERPPPRGSWIGMMTSGEAIGRPTRTVALADVDALRQCQLR
jgi:hypothetical protein